MLDYAINGADSATLSYVQANLLNESGSVKRAASSTTTSSAAQGLLAQYAVDSLNKSLLDTQRQWVLANGSTGNLGDDLALRRPSGKPSSTPTLPTVSSTARLP